MSKVSFAEIPLTRDLSLGTALGPNGIFVKRGSAHAVIYADLVKEGLVEEIQSGAACLQHFRTSELGELVYEQRFIPAQMQNVTSVPLDPRG